MRAAAHLLSVVLSVPALLLASAFLALNHATAQPGMLAVLAALLTLFLAFLPWVFLSAAGLLVLALLGFSARHRWMAALCVIGIVVVSTAVLLRLGGLPVNAGEAVFHVPAAAALAIGLWLAISEWPGRSRG